MNTAKISISTFLFSLACVVCAQPGPLDKPARVVAVDFSKVRGPFSTVWKECIGAGRANEGLRADWQEQLALVQKEIGFRYIRMHGLLHDDMGVYKEQANGNPIYNWQYVDKLYDYLLGIGLKPFVELAFMPHDLASSDKTIFWWRGNITPPKSYEKWGALVANLVRHCVRERVPLDFISTHAYGVKEGFFDETGARGTVLDGDRTAVRARMVHSRELIRKSPLPDLPLHFTEWSSAYTPTDYVHDQYHQAAFILDKIKGAQESVDSLSYWVFTDIFEENGPRMTPFHGGFGLLNYQGIRKPAYYAFQFLNQLGPLELVNADDSSWVTRNAAGDVRALVWDFTPVVPPEGVNDQVFYKQELPARPAGAVSLRVANLPAG